MASETAFDEILRRMDIELVKDDGLKGSWAWREFDKDIRKIVWGKEFTDHRNPCSIAHEIGHFELGHMEKGAPGNNPFERMFGGLKTKIHVYQTECEAWDYAEKLCKTLGVPFDYYHRNRCLNWHVEDFFKLACTGIEGEIPPL